MASDGGMYKWKIGLDYKVPKVRILVLHPSLMSLR